jgi:hypothetical protein
VARRAKPTVPYYTMKAPWAPRPAWASRAHRHAATGTYQERRLSVETSPERRLDPGLVVSDLGTWPVPMEVRDRLPPGVVAYQVVDAHHGYAAAEQALVAAGFGHARAWHYEALGQPRSFLDGEGRLVTRWLRLFTRKPGRERGLDAWRKNPDDKLRELERRAADDPLARQELAAWRLRAGLEAQAAADPAQWWDAWAVERLHAGFGPPTVDDQHVTGWSWDNARTVHLDSSTSGYAVVHEAGPSSFFGPRYDVVRVDRSIGGSWRVRFDFPAVMAYPVTDAALAEHRARKRAEGQLRQRLGLPPVELPELPPPWRRNPPRRNPDDDVQRARRRAAGGDAGDEARLIQQLVRAGKAFPEQVAWVASLGDDAARAYAKERSLLTWQAPSSLVPHVGSRELANAVDWIRHDVPGAPAMAAVVVGLGLLQASSDAGCWACDPIIALYQAWLSDGEVGTEGGPRRIREYLHGSLRRRPTEGWLAVPRLTGITWPTPHPHWLRAASRLLLHASDHPDGDWRTLLGPDRDDGLLAAMLEGLEGTYEELVLGTPIDARPGVRGGGALPLLKAWVLAGGPRRWSPP